MKFFYRDKETAEEKELNILLEKEKEALKEEFDKKIIETEELFKKKIFDMKQTYRNQIILNFS